MASTTGVLERITAVHTAYQLLRSVRDCPEVREPFASDSTRLRIATGAVWASRGSAGRLSAN
jgi:hypothetical protein